MSVTQNYTIVMSSDAWLVTVAALMHSLRDDRKDLERTPIMREWADFINGEVALKSEAMRAMNAATATPPMTREDTHGALEGGMLDTVRSELRCMRGFLVGINERERLARLEAALLFLENQK